ncbi:MAG: hypothetical protein IH983_03325 [Planctomycetes bacterium]|nr:hypothetical protein [Planctomycetota bacterium]
MFRNVIICLLSIVLGPVVIFAGPTIDDLAPNDSVFVASVKNVQDSLERLKRTQLWALWESDQVKALRAEAVEKCTRKLDELLEELGVEEGSLVPPQGTVGIAVFPVMQEDLDATVPGFLFLADFGADADKTGKLIDAVIAKAEEELDLEYEEQEILGRTVYSFDLSDMSAQGIFEAEETETDQPAPMMFAPDPTDVFEMVSALHYVRDGTRFIVCTDLDTLSDALEAIDGDDRVGLEKHEDYQAVVDRLGEVDAYAVLLTRDIARVVAGAEPMMAQMFQSMIQMILGDIKALGCGVRLDSPAAMFEETFVVYMPNGKAGLTALMDTEAPRRDLPPFVGPDAIGYTSMNFEFDGVMEFVRSIGRMNPMLQATIDQLLVEYGTTIENVFAALGPQIHSTVTLSRPIDLSSMKSLYAIECSKPDLIEQVLAEHAGQLDLEPRDFLGRRIYSMPANPMMRMGGPMMGGAGGDGFSIGFGGGYLMIGTTSLVEDALRATGQAGMPSLGDDPAFQQAIRALPAEGVVSWGLANTVDYIEFLKEVIVILQRQEIEQMKLWNPEYAKEMEDELAAKPPPPWRQFDMEILKRYLGPMAWQVHSDPDGFVGTYYLFQAPGTQ